MERNNGSPACASCKHQRKKCTDKCFLAPYFPAEKTAEFQAVQKLFGVSNFTKRVKGVDSVDRQRTADSLIWEATCRKKDPVLGAFGEYQRVCEENQRLREKLYLLEGQQQQLHHQLPAASQQLHQHQVPTQTGSMYYQSRPPISGLVPLPYNRIGVNNGGIINNNNGLNQPNNNGGMTSNNIGLLNYPNNNGSPGTYGYAAQHVQNLEKVRQEKENGSAALIMPPYYPPGQYGS